MRTLVLALLMLTTSWATAATAQLKEKTKDDCKGCDCTHAPVPEKCEKCCGVVKGQILVVGGSSVTLSLEGEKRTFQRTGNTQVEGTLKKGATATVEYRKQNNEAVRIVVE